SQQPGSSIQPGQSTTFAVTFDPDQTGDRKATLSIANSDTDATPYTFAIQGTGVAPEIAISGNGNAIVNGSTTPSAANHTDFGDVDTGTGALTRTFTIQNSGTGTLSLSGDPLVSVSGDHASEFTVSQQPGSSIQPGQSTTFAVTFDPDQTGDRKATLSIANSDTNANPYTFAIQGTGVAPEIAISGNNNPIVNGSTTPSISNHTDFTSAVFPSGQVKRTFTISNTGTDSLSIEEVTAKTSNGVVSSSFEVSQNWSNNLSPGSSTPIVVTFTPNSVGPILAILHIKNSDPDESDFYFHIRGEGIQSVITWTGKNGTPNWNDPANWNLNRAPGPYDMVQIEGAGTIELTASVSISQLLIKEVFTGTLRIREHALTINGDLTIGGGNFLGENGTITVKNSFIQTGGYFSSTSETFTLTSNFKRSGGTFHHNKGEIFFTGPDHTITGSTTFFTFTCDHQTPSIFTFEAETTQTIEGLLKIKGPGETKTRLQSSLEGVHWNLHASGSYILHSLSISDCNNTGERLLSCGNSIDHGHNNFLAFGEETPCIATIKNAPSHPIRENTLALTIGGIGVAYYIWSLDDGPWSTANDVKTPLQLELPEKRSYKLKVCGKSTSGVYQPQASATTLDIHIDRTPPTAQLFGVPTGQTGRTQALVIPKGLQMTCYRFSHNGGTWSPILSCNLPIELNNLSNGSHTLEVIGCDAAGNWQAEDAATLAEWHVSTSLPEAILTQLPLAFTQQKGHSITVSGNNMPLETYRYRLDINNHTGTWYTAPADQPIAFENLSDGNYTLFVNGSAQGLWQDGAEGDTPQAATIHQWTVDTLAPAAATLTSKNSVPDASCIEISWPHTDGFSYRIWYASTAFTQETLDQAISLFAGQHLKMDETTARFQIHRLQEGTRYWFAIQQVDQAGNVSELSNVATTATLALRPVIASISRPDNQTDNGKQRPLALFGSHFMGASGANIVHFTSNEIGFTLASEAGTDSQINLHIPTGAPPGTYQIHVVNTHGISMPSEATCIITEAPEPIPHITQITPALALTGAQTQLTISGHHFPQESFQADLIAPNGTVIPLEGVQPLDDSTFKAHLVLSASDEQGFYSIRINQEHESAILIEICHPINLQTGDALTGAVTTHLPADTPSAFPLPVDINLTTDQSLEAHWVDANPAKISISFEAGTELEKKQEQQQNRHDYDVIILPPRQLPLTQHIAESLGEESTLFSMGAENLMSLKNGRTFYTEIEVIRPSESPAPKIYYVSPQEELSLAGVSGSINGFLLEPGGTPLTIRYDTPFPGQTTWTIGLLMNHMSTYAVGSPLSSPPTPSNRKKFGVCFVQSIPDGFGVKGVAAVLFLFAAGVAFETQRRRAKK
ncbi:MAG: choice-of-anchor D domain-containing protein, partial [Desulfobacterales bacterium]|nr:choice-of-anchor D domain-containing protein [Desulfobacterales bacterium]